MKVCSKCRVEKEIEYFEFRSDTQKYRNQCRTCNKGYISTRLDKLKEINDLLLLNLKKCGKCKEIKDLSEFNTDIQTITGKTSYCKSCISKRYSKEEVRSQTYKSRYGISFGDYKYMYLEQRGKCEICKTFFKQLVVDHCHTTGKVRGLLCSSCNSAIGFFKENLESISNSIDYLNKYK